MFGTLGFSELILILAIVFIIFGAGRLPQLGEGLGKALKGFKKEVHEASPVETETATPPPPDPPGASSASAPSSQGVASPSPPPASSPTPTAPYRPGPELTPGTTAALMASAGPQHVQPRPSQPAAAPTPATQPAASPPSSPGQSPPPAPPPAQAAPPTMEDRLSAPPPSPRGAYPPLPPGAQPKPAAKRPSAIVNKDAVARVQAQQAAMRAAGQKKAAESDLSTQDLQNLGESLGDTLRTFRQAAADVRNAVDPEMRTIRAEMDAAQKEIEQSIEAAKQMPATDEPPKPA